MKAYAARELSYKKNQSKKGIAELDKLIVQATKNGKFSITAMVCYDWGTDASLKAHYEREGYVVDTWYKQTSPNDSDDYISISWE